MSSVENAHKTASAASVEEDVKDARESEQCQDEGSCKKECRKRCWEKFCRKRQNNNEEESSGEEPRCRGRRRRVRAKPQADQTEDGNPRDEQKNKCSCTCEECQAVRNLTKPQLRRMMRMERRALKENVDRHAQVTHTWGKSHFPCYMWGMCRRPHPPMWGMPPGPCYMRGMWGKQLPSPPMWGIPPHFGHRRHWNPW